MFGKKKLIEGLKKKLSDTEAELKASKDLLIDSQEELKDFQKQAFAKKTEFLSSLESRPVCLWDFSPSTSTQCLSLSSSDLPVVL